MSANPAPVAGRLVVCATPIGNLQDITLRVLDALAAADVIACEDTRHTRVLLQRHRIRTPLMSLHEHNERARAGELVARIHAGETVALVSDAGTPLVSDPGFALVREALAVGVEPEVLPGASAVLTALVAAGLPTGRFRFVGFLPRARGELLELVGGAQETLVGYESPRRALRTLELLAEQDAGRLVAVCRELTKLHEEVRRGSAAELARHYREHQPRGEVTLVIGASTGAHERDERIHAALVAVRELVDAGARPRAAAGVVARLTGLRANELYRGLTRTYK